MQEGLMLKLVMLALSAALLPSCATPETAAMSPQQSRLSADASLQARLFETLGACERFNSAPSAEKGFAAHLRRHAPTADETERRALRAAYDRGASPAVASRQTPESCAIALRGHDQEAPGVHGRRDGALRSL